MSRSERGRPDLLMGAARILVLPCLSAAERAADDPGAYLLSEEPLQQVLVQGQCILREDGIAQLLKLIHYFVVETRIVMVRPPKHDNADAVFRLKLVKNLSRPPTDAGFVILHALETNFDCAVVLFVGQTRNRLPGLQHLIRKQFAVGE